ncbi:hypothetical protein HQN89_32610 [Paenibacillus frigoriresistens]|uniref:hypothetical protein n=1 Tax=Paenibacillus alginolyticus TaxID=59839 RepID=UPI0015645EA6|nr:hypothetical protein [Paenibacillus frigoriresistens]NRF95582.1 hypothetical protein [Paenibacillus frigoriresistens]
MSDQVVMDPIILFNKLLTAEEKTTNILENFVGEQLFVHVILQKITEKLMFRESILHTGLGDFIVSHNFALIDPALIPNLLYEKIVLKNEGIGKTLSQLNIESSRCIRNSGWRKKEEVVDLLNNYSYLRFDPGEVLIPFKEYTLTFHDIGMPGIRLIEYFNPQLIRLPINFKL